VSIEDLIKRVDGALKVLKLIVEDIVEVRDALKSMVGEAELPQETTIETVREMLPKNLRGAVLLNEVEDYVIVNLRHHLNSETFKTIAAVAIDRFGGEYVSYGKEGYFRIPKKKEDLNKTRFHKLKGFSVHAHM
jgi:hypothetical protein